MSGVGAAQIAADIQGRLNWPLQNDGFEDRRFEKLPFVQNRADHLLGAVLLVSDRPDRASGLSVGMIAL